MNQNVDRKRIGIFIGFAYGIAWITGLVVYILGGLTDSPTLPGTQISVGFLLIGTVYMASPALANVFTRMITREGWQDTYLRPRFRRGWLYWVICWIGPGLLTLVGAAVFFLLFPRFYDPSLQAIRELIRTNAERLGQAVPEIDPWMVVISQVIQAFLIAPVLNALPTFGEEFGWRAYLQQKLMPLGVRKTMLLMGVIWGVWHWPVIAMGYNYGFDYPGAPFTGLLMMVWFTFVVGTLFGWAVIKAGSVWPAVIGHGALNGIAALAGFFVQGEPNPLLGPLPVGFIGSIGFALVALMIFIIPGSFKTPETQPQ